MDRTEAAIFWFRRDLRLDDNTGLRKAISSGYKILPLFIFDTNIVDELEKDDPRITFIYDQLSEINNSGFKLLIRKGNPLEVIKSLCEDSLIKAVYCNQDYEPYARNRDQKIAEWLNSKGIIFQSLKDQVIFETNDILKKDGKPYTVYTPYKNKWLEALKTNNPTPSTQYPTPNTQHLVPSTQHLVPNTQYPVPSTQYPVPSTQYLIPSFPSLQDLGFTRSSIKATPWSLKTLGNYKDLRDFPAKNSGTYLGPHLRFGTVSVRNLVYEAINHDQTFLQELIWREFFMQILWHFPDVVQHNFKRQYDRVSWRNNETEFEKWCQGKTGYPMVDAGMRELNTTGYMHNRVRMVTASFLCKHLLIDWRWGEAYFAKKLLDYELSSNNGNWQWASGTGCDAAPYFRVFNPTTQQEKFDPDFEYIRKWIPEYGTKDYPQEMVDHKIARERALDTYRNP